uniref:ANAPC4_WD40 domain-containing protein n=1 Tax=Panagrellus redivivus TaxID=6233 RepID=A0A7E4VT99_PANRE
METDYSLQFRLIRQHEHENKKYLNVTVSSTYGCALTLTSIEHEWRKKVQYFTGIKEIWTDMLERRKHEDFEDFRFCSRNFIYYKQDDKRKGFFVKHNCDGRVVATVKSFSKINFYGATTVTPHVGRPHSVRPIHILKLSNSSAKIKMFEWNPINPAMFVVPLAKTLYTVVFDSEKETSRILAKRDMNATITSVSWNPTGTQLIVGDAEGRIHQFNPQLKLIRTVNPPRLIPSVFKDKFACSGLCWVSKTERIVVFTSETSDKLHLTKLTVKPNKPPKWTVWDVLPAVENNRCRKSFNFLPIFKWNTVLMSSPCLSEVYTFSVVNKVWKPLKLDECFTIRAPIEQILKPVKHKTNSRFNRFRKQVEPTLESVFPTSANLHKYKKTFITSMSINYSSQRSAFICQCQSIPLPPVIYVTTSNGMLFTYQMVSMKSERPNLIKPAETIDKKQVANFTCLRLREAGKLSAFGVLEVYAAENENFNKIRDTKERWTAMYHGEAKLIAEMKRLYCKLSADEFVAAVLSILSKPVARNMNLEADGLTVKGSDFFRVENTVLEVVCGVMLVKFMIV